MKLLFLDIETAPNKVFAWGLFDQNISIDQIVENGYTLCWAAKWRGERKVHFDAVWRSGAKKMAAGIHALLDEADAVVHYNGNKFDIPTLNKEFLLHGMPPPSPAKQVDLLLEVRREFRFSSNKLDHVARSLGLGQKVQHKGMALWSECMAGVESAWRTMERYNKGDVTLLEKVYDRTLPWLKKHPNMALFVDSKKMVCPNCGGHQLQARGTAQTTVSIYQRYQCRGCGKWSRGRQNIMAKERKPSVLVGA